MFPSSPLNISTPVGAGMVLIMGGSIASMSFMVYGPILLETLHGVTPLTAGYIVASESVFWGLFAVIVASLKSPNETWLIRFGAALLPLTLLGFALSIASGPVWLILAIACPQGASFGVMWAFLIKRISEHANEGEEDITASTVPTLQQIGFAFGAVATGLIANAYGFGETVSFETASSAAFWIFLAFVPFALLATFAGWQMTQQT